MIRRYKKGDALKVMVQNQQKEEAIFNAQFFDEIVAYSIDDEDEILGVFGFEIKDNIGYCYALLGENIKGKMYEFIKFVRQKIKTEICKNKVDRVLITVKENFDNAKKMAKILGFYEVAKLPLFFNGENYLLYERKE